LHGDPGDRFGRLNWLPPCQAAPCARERGRKRRQPERYYDPALKAARLKILEEARGYRHSEQAELAQLRGEVDVVVVVAGELHQGEAAGRRQTSPGRRGRRRQAEAGDDAF
jgi:hypothetical protein